MNLTLRQLRLFIALADTGSVTEAARRMHVTQPTASDQLKEISKTVGLPLYEVISRQVHLTDLGRDLAKTAREMIESLERFEQLRDATNGLKRGRLRISAVSTAKYFVPRIVGRFCERFPMIDVSLHILNRDGVVDRLNQNADELYIMSMPPSDMALHDAVFMANDLVMIAPTSDAICAMSNVTLEAFETRRFILREQGSGTRMAVNRVFEMAGFRPNVRMELGSNEAVKEAVIAGLGIGIVSRHALTRVIGDQGYRLVDTIGFPIPSSWHVVYPKQRTLSPVAAAFRDELVAMQGNEYRDGGVMSGDS